MLVVVLNQDSRDFESVDEGYLASVSMMDKLPGWRKLADKMGAVS